MSGPKSPFDAAMQHWLPVRVYYEDTDFTGMVYHANYLRFFERGRSEFLRDAGVSHQSLLALPEPAVFTLTNVNVDYKRAARIDDALLIRSRYTGVRGAKVLFEQTALRDGDVIAEAVVTAVMIHADGRPRRPIPDVVARLTPYIFKP
ncbi:YbgC/FadM family acyl-CoA thioesterase [Henriciella marina]|uniref:YbgC/FadM family acyl-CoA thioesterase n=1 Tax=Henriciella marina TaxID=453851 RepID=UPI000381CADD|nr:YbgC/FadM family acyl-CoA thioesterase [Henriciella marina]